MRTLARLALAAAASLVAGTAGAGELPSQSGAAGCTAPAALTVIGADLAHLAARVSGGERLTIVAVGSSSTQGIGATAPNLSYPSRLQAELAGLLPDSAIRVINRGKGGEDAPEELGRLDHDVIAERPDLVIWQVGTNAVLRRDDLAADHEAIANGVIRLRRAGSDVVLMDLQYAPRVIARPAYAAMEVLIASAAERARVGLFRRFDIMRYWKIAERQGDAKMIGPDGLHMTDRGYGCLAADLAQALARNVRAQQPAMRPPRAGMLRAAISQ